MGRLVTRAMTMHPQLELAHVNEHQGGPETAAHLLQFDSVHGRWHADVCATPAGDLEIDGRTIGFTNHADPADVHWGDQGVDLVLECTGAFRTVPTLTTHLANGASKVVVAAPVHDDSVLNIVMGCNDDRYDPARHHIVTAASCTTNCLAPVVKVLHEGVGINHGAITTIHDVTNTQVVVDAPHKDLRRARSALNSLIPTSTGSATAITKIYPELEGRLHGLAVRVPVLNASLTDAVFEVSRSVAVDEINDLFAQAATGPLAGILGYETRPLVSADFVNETRSAVIDAPSTMVVDGTLVKVLAWYDNEYGYVHRLAELAAKIADLGLTASS